RLLARWEGGWISRTVSKAWYREMSVQLPSTLLEEQAEKTADDLLAAFSEQRVEFSADLRPRSNAQRPGTGFFEGDRLNLVDRDLDPIQVRVLAFNGSLTDNGVEYSIEAGDRVRDERERIDAHLRRMAPGAIGGRT